ncbi:MAG: tol-pal system YbgF family protein, partial [Flavobacteriales bacterium]
MSKTIFQFLTIISSLLLFSCSSSDNKPGSNGYNPKSYGVPETKKEMKKNIKELKKELEQKTENKEDLEYRKTTAKNLINTFITFADSFPEHEKTPYYLFEAASAARTYKYPKRAVDIYVRLLNDHPDFNKRKEAKYLIALINDDELNNKK